ncbi:MAG: hypothetical protein R3338_13245 [Thermoanaerobaculia bacterium]|nr:hypothetical protein [Thermoanaerobaculia bacterium]
MEETTKTETTDEQPPKDQSPAASLEVETPEGEVPFHIPRD